MTTPPSQPAARAAAPDPTETTGRTETKEGAGALPAPASQPGGSRYPWGPEIIAGLTTAVLLVPQAMAYAMLAGLPPQVGLAAAVVPLVVYALLGTSRRLSPGPVAMDSILVAAGLGALMAAGTGEYIAAAALLAVAVGVMQMGMGALRMGFLLNFVSQPVITGFMAGAAVLIASSQVPALLGIQAPDGSGPIAAVTNLAARFGTINVATLVLSTASVAALVLLKRYAPRAPRALIVVAATAIVAIVARLDSLGVALIGEVPRGLPAPGMPQLDLLPLGDLLPLALSIAIVSFTETISTGRSLARTHGGEVPPNRELVAIGAANVAAGLFRGFPIAGGLSRSVVNAQAGASRRLSAFVTAGFVALVAVALTPLLAPIPRAALAAIIITAVIQLIDVAEMRRLWTVKRADAAMLGVTMLATLVIGPQYGLLVGVGASVILFMVRTTRPHAAVLGRVPGTTAWRNVRNYPDAITVPGTMVVRIDAQFYFGNVTFLRDALHDFERHCTGRLRTVVLDASSINQLDSSADDALHGIVEAWRARGVCLRLANVKQPVYRVMEASGLVDRIGRDHIHLTVEDAVMAAIHRDEATNPTTTTPGPLPTRDDAPLVSGDHDDERHTRQEPGALSAHAAASDAGPEPHATTPTTIATTEPPNTTEIAMNSTNTTHPIVAAATPCHLGFREVTVDQVRQLASGARLVDVRELDELHGPMALIDGAEHVPLGSLARTVDSWNRDEPVVLICRSGGRSGRGAMVMEQMGFTQVVSMAGGMIAWAS